MLERISCLIASSAPLSSFVILARPKMILVLILISQKISLERASFGYNDFKRKRARLNQWEDWWKLCEWPSGQQNLAIISIYLSIYDFNQISIGGKIARSSSLGEKKLNDGCLLDITANGIIRMDRICNQPLSTLMLNWTKKSWRKSKPTLRPMLMESWHIVWLGASLSICCIDGNCGRVCLFVVLSSWASDSENSKYSERIPELAIRGLGVKNHQQTRELSISILTNANRLCQIVFLSVTIRINSKKNGGILIPSHPMVKLVLEWETKQLEAVYSATQETRLSPRLESISAVRAEMSCSLPWGFIDFQSKRCGQDKLDTIRHGKSILWLTHSIGSIIAINNVNSLAQINLWPASRSVSQPKMCKN